MESLSHEHSLDDLHSLYKKALRRAQEELQAEASFPFEKYAFQIQRLAGEIFEQEKVLYYTEMAA